MDRAQNYPSRRNAMRLLSTGIALSPLFARRISWADSPSVGEIIFGEIERRIIQDYYRRQLDNWQAENNSGANNASGGGKKHKNFPPGLAKKGKLPPGLEKQLARNGHLPPGLESRDLPGELEDQLPVLPSGYQYKIVDNRVLLVERATNLVLDVIEVAAADLLD